MKLTPWFSADVNPVRPGIYEVDFGRSCTEYQTWSGRHWFYGGNTVSKTAADKSRWVVPESMRRPWRGLAKEPK